MAHYRSRITWRTLGTVPILEVAPSIGEQLADALATAGVSKMELARRLSASHGGTVASKRRWLQKLLRDDVKKPNMAAVEAALNLPAGYFAIPTPEERERQRVRLAEVAAEVAQHYRFLDRLDQAIELLAGRVEALERRDAPGASKENHL